MMKLQRPESAAAKWTEALRQAERLASGLTADDPAADRAEVFGVRAGLLKRLGKDDLALASYADGAKIETAAKLGSTYNRMNEIRAALLLKTTTIGQAEAKLVEVASVLETRLNDPDDTAARSDGWLWADLGDVCTLLGRFPEAEKYYRAFTQMAGNEARITRETLELLLQRVTEAGDPDAGRVNQGLAALARAARPQG